MPSEGKSEKVNDLKPVRAWKIKPAYLPSVHRIILKKNYRTLKICIIAVVIAAMALAATNSPYYQIAKLLVSTKNEKILIGFQNSAELRPTGGFWGSFGILEVQKNLIDSKFYFETNPYKNDNPLLAKSTELLPRPMRETYPDRPQSFVNANWPVNFPDTAKSLEWFLAQGWNEEVNGTIAVSSLAIIDLLKDTGPIKIDEQTTLTSDNFSEVLSKKIEIEYWQNPENINENEPKTILKNITPEVIKRMKKLGPIKLSRFTLSQIKKGRLIFFFNDPPKQRIAKKLGNSGEILPYDKDYLHINNANLNGGKSSLNVKQSIDYEINSSAARPLATLKITRNLNNDWPNIVNRNYTRVFVPLGSRLISAKLDNLDIQPSLEISQENVLTTFGFWFSTGPGESKTVELQYELPFEKSQLSDYNLTYQKQPGTLPEKLKINLDGREIASKTVDGLVFNFHK